MVVQFGFAMIPFPIASIAPGLTSLTTSSETYREARLNARGVNIDTELQNLTLIEQSYNANSQALRVASEMIDTLLSLTS